MCLNTLASLPELSLWLLAAPDVVKISAVLRLAAALSQRSRKGTSYAPAPKTNTLALLALLDLRRDVTMFGMPPEVFQSLFF